METIVRFSYGEAFSRNLGWVTDYEQSALRSKRVAIAGMGGVGGFHLLTLVRFGIGSFSIADGDRFELVNFNRQMGATLDSIGRSKVAVMEASARAINPELRITCFDQGLTEQNLDAFLAGADLCIDGLDYFALDIRRNLNARCRERRIPVINAAPLGMGTAYLIFLPDGMSFEEWFCLDGLTEEERYVSYLVGMAPSGLHRRYLVDPSRVDLRAHRGPSTVAGCELCAAVASVEAIKLLLRRGRVFAAPFYHQFDAYSGRWVVRKLRGGNKHPLQRIKIALTRRLATQMSQMAGAVTTEDGPKSELEAILDDARWAPSGDNIQPWRFQILGDDRILVHLSVDPDDFYDYRGGEPTLLSGGMLLESLRIAATRFGRGMEWHYRGREGNTHELEVWLPLRPGTIEDPLLSFLFLRSVDRRPYRVRRLTDEEKNTLAAALGPDLKVDWYEEVSERWRMARFGAKATAIRLRLPEAFPIHQRVIDWNQQFSATGIPAGATGISGPSLWLLRWGMQSWPRMRLLNRFGGVFAGALQMDYVPGICCAGFFALTPTRSIDSAADRAILLLEAGQRIQRFWLTATSLGLAIQPNLAPLCFSKHGVDDTHFTSDSSLSDRTKRYAELADLKVPGMSGGMIFHGRLGRPASNRTKPRSVRRPLNKLMGEPAQNRDARVG